MNALTNLKCTLALSAGFCSSFANAQKQPHIILIMTDQQRGDAVGCMGNEFVITPHLDKLANEGTLFMNAYSSCPSSTPARAGLLTGMSPWHHGMLGYGRVAPKYEYEMPQMLKDAGYKVPEINMEAYMKVRALVQEFMDDFLGLYISPKNRLMNSLLIGPGLPGGMMGSLMADLEKNLETINKSNIKNNKPLMSQDQLLIKLFDEVAYVWPRVGYPPLVTPFSQYVKNLALMNVMQMEKGKARWSMIADDIWDMILGKAGRLPGPLAPEIVEKAKAEGRQFFEGNPQDNYPDALDKYRKLMNEKQWEVGEDEEELFEYAMHPAQYEAYRSGKAKVEFKADVAKRKAEKANAGKPTVPATPAAPAPAPAAALTMPTTPQVMTVDVNGQAYRVTVAFGDTNSATPEVKPTAAPAPTAPETTNAPAGAGKEVLSPLEGKFFLIKNASDTPVKVGDVVKEGDVLCYVEAMKTYNAVRAEFGGTITAICLSSGDAVSEDDVLMTIQ